MSHDILDIDNLFSLIIQLYPFLEFSSLPCFCRVSAPFIFPRTNSDLFSSLSQSLFRHFSGKCSISSQSLIIFSKCSSLPLQLEKKLNCDGWSFSGSGMTDWLADSYQEACMTANKWQIHHCTVHFSNMFCKEI